MFPVWIGYVYTLNLRGCCLRLSYLLPFFTPVYIIDIKWHWDRSTLRYLHTLYNKRSLLNPPPCVFVGLRPRAPLNWFNSYAYLKLVFFVVNFNYNMLVTIMIFSLLSKWSTCFWFEITEINHSVLLHLYSCVNICHHELYQWSYKFLIH